MLRFTIPFFFLICMKSFFCQHEKCPTFLFIAFQKVCVYLVYSKVNFLSDVFSSLFSRGNDGEKKREERSVWDREQKFKQSSQIFL